MGHLIPDIVNAVVLHGYLAIFLITAVEEAGLPLPLPGDGVLLFAGYLTVHGPLSLPRTIFVVDLAVVVGASILYCLAYRGGRPLLVRYGRYLRIGEPRLDQLMRLYQRLGPLGPGISRLVPGMRIYTSALSGLALVSYRRFILNVAWAATLWAGVFLLLGRVIGEQWREYSNVSGRISIYAISAIAVLVLAAWGVRRGRRRLARRRCSRV